MENPLLDFSDLPRFAEIKSYHVEEALDFLLDQSRMTITKLSKISEEPDWENFVKPLNEISEKIDRLWSIVSHINAVCDSSDFRSAYESSLKKLTLYKSEVGQNQDLYIGYKAVQDNMQLASLDAAKQKVIKNTIRDFRLSGVDLSNKDRTKFRNNSEKLASLANRFEQNLLDATDSWYLDVSDQKDLVGLPNSAVALAKQTAESAGFEGWRFTLHAPSYIPFMMFSERPELRREIYTAYVTRGSEIGPNSGKWDNSKIMEDILDLRLEQANLLGYPHYSDYALVTRMATERSTVDDFLDDLLNRTKPQAEIELKELSKFASENDNDFALEAWDFPYWSERLRQSRYQFNQEEVRPFFPLPRVLEGMYEIVRRLFGITIRPAAQSPQMWHIDAMYFEIIDVEGELRGSFYLDLYARPNKRGGAWMGDCISRHVKADGQQQKPVAFMTCNFSPPLGDQPSLLTHEDVLTLFHEFGHGLHHMLTQVNEPAVSGINGVPWDAVELPSQFLENWCWESDGLDLISGHVVTGEKVPLELLNKLKNARNFQSGLQMVRQLEFSVFDFRLHSEWGAKNHSIQDVLDNVRNDVSVVKVPEFNRFQHSFSHIFAGGYAAGYYSYKWAEVLSADAFSRFETEGLFDQTSGRAFLREILEPGGVKDPMSMFVAFLGRKPSVDTLLRHLGFVP
tara:strand:- start:4510 stop:6552 length:2043 start_codon:yes stop_codon:yes gene_type:complete